MGTATPDTGTDTGVITQAELHGGQIVARVLKAHGVTTLFTLSGAHIFPIYDGCRSEGIRIVDVRHEQTAAFAAEGWAKLTRTPGVCAVTAGPGVTNTMSAIASARQNGSPMVVLGGRAPQHRWGQGSLQEIDHVPFVRPLAIEASTVATATDIASSLNRALTLSVARSGPVFLDLPLDELYSTAPAPDADTRPVSQDTGQGAGNEFDATADVSTGDGLEAAAELLASARRPVVMAGTGAWFAHGEHALARLVERHRVPCLVNGLGRGMLAADHELFFARARGMALREADVALVVGVPMDFRLGFGEVFGPDTAIVAINAEPPAHGYQRTPAVALHGDVAGALDALAGGGAAHVDVRGEWATKLRGAEDERRSREAADVADDRAPLHPMRVLGELRTMLARDAVVIGDGGDFVSFAGKVIDTYEPGCFLDPGPFGCLGSGPGYALAASLARPGAQVVLLVGDGAFGFAGLDFDSFVRHGLPVVAVMGNNGAWALEKHPMELLFGYSVAADLQPACRYDQVVAALGGHGEFVQRPDELRPALERAFACGKPALVNVLTDPAIAYPRSTNLA